MKNRIIVLILGAIITGFAILIPACRKINEATELGGGLIPPIDNINTFDTTLDIQAFNDTFGLANDSQYLANSEEHFLGLINNDPIFGKTDARIFLQLKPTFFHAYPFARKDSVKIDSVVLILSYVETYGDSSVPQTVNVYEMDPSNNFTADSAYLIRKNDFIYPPLATPGTLGTRTFIPVTLEDSVKAFQDTTFNQMRISLDTNFGRRLFNYDTTNAYNNDSIFNANFRGFALQSMSTGNALMGFNLNGTNTKLAVYYSQPTKTGTIDSTTVTYFTFTSSSAAANYVKRDYTGTPVEASVGGAAPDPFVYMQNSPGTFATLKIPGLSSIGNRIIHRAELIAEEVYDPSDTIFKTPAYMFLDAYDTTDGRYRTIPYDLSFDASGSINFSSFGSLPETTLDGSGNTIHVWKFNISRYVQHILTQTQKQFDLRLFSGFSTVDLYGVPPTIPDFIRSFIINPTIAKGRVRLAGNNGIVDTNPHKMRLHIVYSKL